MNTLSGGKGSDLFVFSFKGTDIINDFASDCDLLQLPLMIDYTDLTITEGQNEVN